MKIKEITKLYYVTNMYKGMQTGDDGGPPFLRKHTKLPSHLQSSKMLENLGLNYLLIGRIEYIDR